MQRCIDRQGVDRQWLDIEYISKTYTEGDDCWWIAYKAKYHNGEGVWWLAKTYNQTLEVELYMGLQVFLVKLQVMDIHPSYSILSGRSWIHMAGVVAFSLHQCLKYIMNGMLVTVKDEETISIIRNIVVPFIENYRDENIHAFKIMNVEWLSENTVLTGPNISKTTRMIVNRFFKHGIPFQFDPDTGMLEQVNLMKLKCANQRFKVRYNPNKDECRRVTRTKKEARMIKLKEWS